MSTKAQIEMVYGPGAIGTLCRRWSETNYVGGRWKNTSSFLMGWFMGTEDEYVMDEMEFLIEIFYKKVEVESL